MNKLKHIQIVFMILFGSLILYLLKFLIFDQTTVQNNIYNPRRLEVSGRILDQNKHIIAKTEQDIRAEDQLVLQKRVYPDQNLFAHIVGDISKSGQVAGIETKYRKDFFNENVLVRLKDILLQKPSEGNDVILTIDYELQKIAYNGLGNRKGAVIAIEPNTGKILAMVSKPDFDPNNIAINTNDIQEGTFLNRGTQATFEPGSTFKIITALAALKDIGDWETFEYISEGKAEFKDWNEKITVSDFREKAYGSLHLPEALKVSSNTFFAALGQKLGAKKIKSAADLFDMNESIEYDRFVSRKASTLQKDQGLRETILSSFGQGKVQVTPMHMAMLTATIANGGIQMQPYLVDRIETPSGYIIRKNLPKVKREVISFDEAKNLTDMMIGVVDQGTGVRARISNVKVAGKTGTAENPRGDDHAWFVGFAPAEHSKIAVVVLVENGGEGGKVAAPIAREMMQHTLQRK